MTTVVTSKIQKKTDLTISNYYHYKKRILPSNSSRKGSFVNDGSKLTDSNVLLRVVIIINNFN